METKHWDVIIVGGGMAGLLTAYFLWEQGRYVLVLEANELASGQTDTILPGMTFKSLKLIP